jgi:hypothetical protein
MIQSGSTEHPDAYAILQQIAVIATERADPIKVSLSPLGLKFHLSKLQPGLLPLDVRKVLSFERLRAGGVHAAESIMDTMEIELDHALDRCRERKK